MTWAIPRAAWLALPLVLFGVYRAPAQSDTSRITKDKVEGTEALIGIKFNDAERDSMLDALKEDLRNYDSLRTIRIGNEIPPAIQFNPIPVGFKFQTQKRKLELSPVRGVKPPERPDDLAFFTVRELGELIRAKRLTSTMLTKLCIARLKKYDPMLHCVITLTEDMALREAAKADSEIASGKYRGPLHGIPYGAKDLLAAKGYKTTWGSAPYKEQVIDEDATVIKKLREAGAVLVAKLTLGELAWGDVWYGGMTRNPWDTSQGSSGSSAGPASAVAAGLVPFAIGTETWGSIVSPSTRCGTTGLRPTYGRVSRTGAMALSWSMDKIGPICRTVEDCAIVFDAIIGTDGIDQTLHDLPFNYTRKVDLTRLRIGYLKADFDSDTSNVANNKATIELLGKLGAKLIAIELPKYPIDAMSFILDAEAAAAFEELTLSGRDSLMVRQVKDAWPNVFRSARFIPAVEYIQANRFRYMIIQRMAKLMDSIDVYVAPPFEGNNLLLTNLTSNPCVVLPNGFDAKGHPESVTFVGRLFDEATVLAVAKAYQDATEFHRRHPKL
jgi:Asp-tRNA(Asn)/Glu-tRNA(Gln) amidotransferase A subunit family amidase